MSGECKEIIALYVPAEKCVSRGVRQRESEIRLFLHYAVSVAEIFLDIYQSVRRYSMFHKVQLFTRDSEAQEQEPKLMFRYI